MDTASSENCAKYFPNQTPITEPATPIIPASIKKILATSNGVAPIARSVPISARLRTLIMQPYYKLGIEQR